MHFSLLSKCNFIEFKDISVDAIVLNLAASVYYQGLIIFVLIFYHALLKFQLLISLSS